MDSTNSVPEEKDVPRICDDILPILIEDNDVDKPTSVAKEIQTIPDRIQSPLIPTCSSPEATSNDKPHLANNVERDCRVVVIDPVAKTLKTLVTSETQTDFPNQIDGLPTPSGSEDRNNEDPLTFIAPNKPLVYAPIPVVITESDNEHHASSKDTASPQSPTISQVDTVNKEKEQTIEVGQNEPEASPNCR